MPFVLWMTGLPCSGKTTIAKRLQELYPKFAVLDGDELREWLSPKDFSRDARNEHNRRVAHLAKQLLKHNVSVLVSLISPFKENREDARKVIGDDKFIEAYIKCSLSVCEERDVKGMYKKARLNEIEDFIGINTDYEIPDNPHLTVNTETCSLDECVSKILNFLKSMKLQIFKPSFNESKDE